MHLHVARHMQSYMQPWAPGRESLEGGGVPPSPHGTALSLPQKAFPHPNTRPNRIANRQ